VDGLNVGEDRTLRVHAVLVLVGAAETFHQQSQRQQSSHSQRSIPAGDGYTLLVEILGDRRQQIRRGCVAQEQQAAVSFVLQFKGRAQVVLENDRIQNVEQQTAGREQGARIVVDVVPIVFDHVKID